MRSLLFVGLLLFGSIQLFSQSHTFKVDVCDKDLSKQKRKIARSIIVALEQGRPDIMSNYYEDSSLSDINHAEEVIARFYQKPVRKSFPLVIFDTTQSMNNRYYRLYSKSKNAKNAPSARIEIVFGEHELSFVVEKIIVHEGINEDVDKNSVLYLITCGRPPRGGISRETFFGDEIDDKTLPVDLLEKDITILMPKEKDQLKDVANASGVNIKLSIAGYNNWLVELEGIWQCRAIQHLNISFPVGHVLPPALDSLFQMTWLKHLSISFELGKIYNKQVKSGRYRPHHIPDNFDNFKELESLKLYNFYSDIPPSIFDIKGLKTLYLHGEFASIPASFSKLEELERVSIANLNMESFPDAVSSVSNIRALTISLPRIKNIPNEIANLKKLRTFTMWKMDSIQSLPNDFGKLDSLRRIDYSSMKMIPASPSGGLKGLDSLKVSHVADCSRLEGYNNVKYLHLMKGEDETFSQALKSFQNLERLEIRRFKNLLNIPESSGLPMLKMLMIDESKITKIPSFITSSPNLSWVNLRDNQIEEIPEEITNLTRIEELVLINNKVTHIPSELCQLPVCTQVSLGGNYIESIDPELFDCQRGQKMVISVAGYRLQNMSKEELKSKSTDGLQFQVY